MTEIDCANRYARLSVTIILLEPFPGFKVFMSNFTSQTNVQTSIWLTVTMKMINGRVIMSAEIVTNGAADTQATVICRATDHSSGLGTNQNH
jgi:hypothetical protein